MNSATIIINYGLAAINATTDSANAGMSAFLLICKNACYQVGNDITGDSYAELTQDTEKTDKLIPLGQVGNGGKIDKQYVNVTPWYLDGDPGAEPDPDNDWKYRVLVVRNAEDGGDTYGTVVDASEAVMFRPDPINFTLSLATKSGGELLDANDSLEITVTCPDAIFEQDGALSEGDFSQEVAVYWLTEGVGVGEIFSAEATHGLVASKKLDKNTRQFTVIDSGTGHEGFNPRSTYRYAAVIRAYASNNNTIYSDEIVVGTASGDTDACLKFSNTYEAGQLWVGDLAENIVSAQNTSGTQSFGDTSFKRVNLGGKHLNIVAFKGNAGSFESWLEGTVNAAEFGQIAYANLPAGLGGYGASVSGTFRMYLDLLEDPLQPLSVSVEKKNDLNLVYNGSTGYSVSDLFNIGISDPENGEGVIVTYQVVGENNDAFLENPTITDAGTYKIKIKFECEGYTTFISDSGDGEGYVVEIAPKEVTLRYYAVPALVQDSAVTTVDVDTSAVELWDGENPVNMNKIDIASCVCDYGNADTHTAGSNIPVVIRTTLIGEMSGNYIVKDEETVGEITQIQVPGISLSQIGTATYTGESQDIRGMIETNGIAGDTVLYDVSGGYNYIQIPEVTNAGEYTVAVKVSREGYADWVGNMVFVVAKKSLTLTYNGTIEPVYVGDDSVFDLNPSDFSVDAVGRDMVQVTETKGQYQNTSQPNTNGNAPVRVWGTIAAGSRTNYQPDQPETIVEIGTIRPRKTYTLTANGNPSSEGVDASTTDKLTMVLSAAPDTALTLSDVSLLPGPNYITMDSISADTENDPTGCTYVIGVTRTGTAGNGIDYIKLRVNAPDIEAAPTNEEVDGSTVLGTKTYLVTAYWGVYPGETVPSLDQALENQYGHALTTSAPFQLAWDIADISSTGEEACYPYVLVYNGLGTVSGLIDSLQNNVIGNYNPFSSSATYPNYGGVVRNLYNEPSGAQFTVELQ